MTDRKVFAKSSLKPVACYADNSVDSSMTLWETNSGYPASRDFTSNQSKLNLLEPDFFFNFCHLYIKCEKYRNQMTLELLNKLNFEEKKRRIYTMFKISVPIFVE